MAFDSRCEDTDSIDETVERNQSKVEGNVTTEPYFWLSATVVVVYVVSIRFYLLSPIWCNKKEAIIRENASAAISSTAVHTWSIHMKADEVEKMKIFGLD